MSQTYKTEGIILRRWDYREQDRMVRLLTRDYGKITARAISARKNGAKLAGSLEPFIETELFLARSKTIDIVAGSNAIAPHRRLRQSLHHNALASFFADIVDRLTQEHEVDERLYTHVRDVLRWFAEHDAQVVVAYAAVLQLFALLGYRVDWYQCHQCKRRIEPTGSKLHYALWNVECAQCSTPDYTTPLSQDAIKVLRFMHHESWSKSAKLSIAPATWQTIDSVIRSMIRYHFGAPIPSEAVFLQLLSTRATVAG